MDTREFVKSEAMSKTFLLDTCYIISLLKSYYPFGESISRLKAGKNEVATTWQVIGELEAIASERRKDEKGGFVLTPKQMCEIRSVLFGGQVSILTVEITSSIREAAQNKMRELSPKNNTRVGEGELSLLAAASFYPATTLVGIMSQDSDVKVLIS